MIFSFYYLCFFAAEKYLKTANKPQVDGEE